MKYAIVTGKLGAGRTKAGEAINFSVGLTITSHIGSKVETGKVPRHYMLISKFIHILSMHVLFTLTQ